MKKIFPIITVIACIILTGCSKKEEKPETTTEKKTDNTTTQTTPVPTITNTEKAPDANASTEEKKQQEQDGKEPEKKETELRDKSGAIRVKFPAGATEIMLNGKINGFGDKITYVVEARKGQTLLTRVMSAYPEKNPDANIRLSQIISPSGKIEGPFGVKITLNLTESGDWKIVLGEDQMAGNPWKGEYKLLISIN